MSTGRIHRKSNRFLLRPAAVFALAALTISQLGAWGTTQHSHIVDAALSVIPAADGLVERLGAEANRLRVYVLLGDWSDSYVGAGETWHLAPKPGVVPESIHAFYSSDYLVFPEAQRNYQHGVPEVKQTYRPFFLRALQALRTESPTNAARWIGSLLHYVTDTGSPPHAAGIPGSPGDTHTRMENWLDASRADMNGYRPRLLGETDSAALTGFLARMDELIEFSKLRAERMKPVVAAGNRAACEPIALESAAETAKVVADTLHTLLLLSRKPGEAGAELSVEISAPSYQGGESLPAKLVLLETLYSTTSDLISVRGSEYRGMIRLQNLPPGTYRAVLSRPGCRTTFEQPVTLRAGQRLLWSRNFQLSDTPGNLIRNPDFRIRWVNGQAPDNWRLDAKTGNWLSDNIYVEPGKSYRLGWDLAQSSRKLGVQWMAEHWKASGPIVWIEPAGPGDSGAPTAHLQAPEAAHYVKIVINGRADPTAHYRSVHLTSAF